MKIALASDHAGFTLKEDIAAYLRQRGVEVLDVGCFSEEPVNYVDFGRKAMECVRPGECDRAILVCGTGLGMAIVANKFRGIRATPCWDEKTATVSRKHNDSNCLALGGRVLTPEAARGIVRIWLETAFEGGRHSVRLASIDSLEREFYKS